MSTITLAAQRSYTLSTGLVFLPAPLAEKSGLRHPALGGGNSDDDRCGTLCSSLLGSAPSGT